MLQLFSKESRRKSVGSERSEHTLSSVRLLLVAGFQQLLQLRASSPRTSGLASHVVRGDEVKSPPPKARATSKINMSFVFPLFTLHNYTQYALAMGSAGRKLFKDLEKGLAFAVGNKGEEL